VEKKICPLLSMRYGGRERYGLLARLRLFFKRKTPHQTTIYCTENCAFYIGECSINLMSEALDELSKVIPELREAIIRLGGEIREARISRLPFGAR